MAFAASTACCKPSPLLAPRASSLRAQAVLCRPSSTATTPRGLRAAAPASAFAQTPAPRRRAASTGIVCGKVTKGSVPPNFTLKDQDGKTVSLSKYKGKPVVLYFYPADETPGCTKQIIRRREKTFTAFGSFGASSPLASPLPSKRHGSTAVQALLSSPDHTPQQHRLPIPSQGGIQAAAAASKRQPTQEPGTGEEITVNAGGRTCELPTWALIGGITAGVALALALSVDAGPAMALGPEGPLVEEFWDNMRRYGLYALTVSTGFAWALVQPIVELLRNPITAVLIIFVIAGGGVLVSQVINAMAGNSDFIYMYEQ
ncbi:uncharacterized protein LOC100838766 isoform X1 [Brachypodium distachyon]|uniref:Uncharacterized protein ycf33 n=1 Tax=Brachypodium distachyon TaxID=15368 RepID=A0A0Q3K3X6_BRADI|nr:uncharacterized protein LOC100838766 isoform X1 [Brachypodium distachyon]KQK19148.1 hypothetical protein BRADI_1g46622v3 [Brachypodium distachyon]|eukprot:XP_003564151.1 uncharacterized protein LOC100838766 isoform X1 [Brachypodium distachyon]